MNFWSLLRWLATAAFVGIWLLRCGATPLERTEAPMKAPRPAPEFRN